MASTSLSLPPSVTLTQGQGGLECVRVSTPRCTGEVYLNGATVTEWTPAAGQPVLFLSAHSRFESGVPIRGGVPLCAPWFGAGRKNDMAPAHGFFRTAEWVLTEAQDQDGTVSLTFTLSGDDLPADFPGELSASYVVTFGDELDLQLTVNAGDEDLDLEEALHTYFRVGDVRQVTIDGMDGGRYVDKAPGGRAVNAQSGPVQFTRETDRIYAHDGSATINDPALGRTIEVTKEGSASTVVWNPWEAKAAALEDFGDDEWPTMVCVESGNVVRQALTVPAGTAQVLRQHVAVTA